MTEEDERAVKGLCELWGWVLDARTRLLAEIANPLARSGFISELPESIRAGFVARAEQRLSLFDEQLLRHTKRAGPPWALQSDWFDPGDGHPPLHRTDFDILASRAIEAVRGLLADAKADGRPSGSASTDDFTLPVNVVRDFQAAWARWNPGKSAPTAVDDPALREALCLDETRDELDGPGMYGGGPMKAAMVAVASLGPLTYGELQSARKRASGHEKLPPPDRRIASRSGGEP